MKKKNIVTLEHLKDIAKDYVDTKKDGRCKYIYNVRVDGEPVLSATYRQANQYMYYIWQYCRIHSERITYNRTLIK